MPTAKKRKSPKTWTPKPPGRLPTEGEVARLKKFIAAGSVSKKNQIRRDLALAAEIWAERQRVQETADDK